MAEPMNVRFTVRAGQVTDWNIDNSKREHGGREKQFEIAERVEIAEIAAPFQNPLVIAAS